MLQVDCECILYHGTVSEIKQVDVTKGRGRKDFGKGFYIAISKKQAIGMMHKKYKEILRRNRNKSTTDVKEYLYEIELDKEYLESLNVKQFYTPNLEWLDFILRCREHGGTPHDYDLVIGPTADDDRFYGKVGTHEAKNILLNNLEPENLGVQYFIGKQEVADRLIKSMKEIDWR